MSVDGNSNRAKSGQTTAPLEDAKAALVSLLKTTRMSKAPSQVDLAKKLKKEIEDLRSAGVSFDAISAHLKASGISISKNALGVAVKKKTRRKLGTERTGSRTSTTLSSNPAASV